MRILIVAFVAALLAPVAASARGCRPSYDWVKLAAEPVTAEGGDVELAVDPDAGGFYAVMFEAKESRVALINVRVVFKNGRFQSPKRELVLGPSTPHAYVDFSQNLKEIDHVEFTYRVLYGTALGEISVWGKKLVASASC